MHLLQIFATFPLIFAEAQNIADEAVPAGGGGGDPGMNPMYIWIIVIMGMLMFWFLLSRPNKREQERRQKLLDSFEKHVKVYTVGGMVGTIHSIDREKNRVVIKVDDGNNTKIEFILDAIAGIVEEDKSKDS